MPTVPRLGVDGQPSYRGGHSEPFEKWDERRLLLIDSGDGDKGENRGRCCQTFLVEVKDVELNPSESEDAWGLWTIFLFIL